MLYDLFCDDFNYISFKQLIEVKSTILFYTIRQSCNKKNKLNKLFCAFFVFFFTARLVI